MFFPNAFTPDKDGKNDVFKIVNVKAPDEYHLSVFSRWGHKIFETVDHTKGWDGKLKGIDQDAGMYIWKCRFKRSNLVTTLDGAILLIR